LKYARWLLAVTAACLPLYAVRWDYGRLPTTLLENLIVATVLVYLVALWRERKWDRLLSLRTAYDIPILLLLAAGVVSLLIAKDHRAALGLYKAYFIEPVVLFYVATDLLRRRDDFRTVLLGFGIGTSLFALLNIGYFVAAFVTNTVQYGAPPSAIYTSSNEVAMFLEPPAAFATAVVLFSDQRRDRRLALVCAICLGVALLLTFSRGAYLALAVFAILTLITVRPALRKPLLAIAVVAALLVVVTIVVASNTPLMQSRFSYVALNYTLQTRSIIYVATWHMLTAHPILGLGLGGYVYVLHGFPEIYPHDVYLAFWAELGLLGLLAFAVILGGLLWHGWRALPQAAGFERAMLWGALGSFALWGVHGIFDTPYWKNDMSVEFWLVAAIEVAVIRRLVSHPGLKEPEGES
jgi:putative inorganic carbon (hco3(-)) transporter